MLSSMEMILKSLRQAELKMCEMDSGVKQSLGFHLGNCILK